MIKFYKIKGEDSNNVVAVKDDDKDVILGLIVKTDYAVERNLVTPEGDTNGRHLDYLLITAHDVEHERIVRQFNTKADAKEYCKRAIW